MFDDYNNLPLCHDIKGPKTRTKDVILDDEMKFSALLLEEEIQKGLKKCGYQFLSPIQKNALPLALTGKSIIAHAKSGTGKTLIYLLTALNLFLKSKPETLFTLILAPTREIAKQIYDVCKNVSYFIEGLKVEFFIGGISLDIDVIKCKTCHIAIGAPGRIKHLISLGELKIQKVRLLVLDEVDVLVNNKEFAITEVVASLPACRQTIVCTATYSDNIGVLLKPISADLEYINVNEEETRSSSTASNMLLGIEQYVLPVHSDSTTMDTIRTRNTLVDLLKNFQYDQCFVFVNYISLVKSIYNFLTSSNLSALWLSSEQNQSMRMATLRKLKLNECKILVTTDLAARGIDVHNVNLVVNLGLPMPPDVYVHRMGRAGRYGSKGSVITIVREGEEFQLFLEMLRYVISEPVTLYVMPREVNAETLRGQFNSLKCDPQPDSAVIHKFIAKRSAKIENQPIETKGKKKKNRKRKAKDKCTLRSVSQAETVSSSSEKGFSVLRSTLTDAGELKQRFTAYISTLRSNLDKCATPTVELGALVSLLTPANPNRTKLFFTDYYKEPSAEKVCEVITEVPSIDESLQRLAEFTTKTNCMLDSYKIPLSLPEFFALTDQHEELIITKETNDRVQKLKKEILEKLRELRSQTVLNERDSDTTDCGIFGKTSNWQDDKHISSSTIDSQEPPIKLKHTVKGIAPSSIMLSSSIRDPVVHTSSTIPTIERKLLSGTVHEIPLNEEQSNVAPVSANILEPSCRTADKASQHKQFSLLETSSDVQCPRCHYTFSIQSNTAHCNEQTNMLTSLSPYVSQDVAQKIYRSHFDYIASCVWRNQAPDINSEQS